MGINGSPSMAQVAAEFGGSAPHALTEYRGVRFSDGSYAPSSGAISLNNFRNKSKYVAPPPYVPPPPPPYCFSLDAPIQLQNGEIVPIEDLKLGDFLMSGGTVDVLLKIKNMSGGRLHRLFSDKLNDWVYVTGGHLIKHNEEFKPVYKHERAEISELSPEIFMCIVTSDHTIHIGEYVFWDWSDTCDACNSKICK
jgi:hypothetical protein